MRAFLEELDALTWTVLGEGLLTGLLWLVWLPAANRRRREDHPS